MIFVELNGGHVGEPLIPGPDRAEDGKGDGQGHCALRFLVSGYRRRRDTGGGGNVFSRQTGVLTRGFDEMSEVIINHSCLTHDRMI